MQTNSDHPMKHLGTLTDEHFLQTRVPVFPSSLGGHLRHDLDHYLNFLRGLPDGPIDYETRDRDVQLETHREYAMDKIRSILGDLKTLGLDGQHPVAVRVEEDKELELTQSTIRRELDFLLSHTIHHQAIISMIVRDMGLLVPEFYGVAPSTLRHIRRSSCVQ